MSSLARFFISIGAEVAGYDRAPSVITDALLKLSASIHFEDKPELIPDSFKNDPDQTLVVYTPAVPDNHAELNYFINNGFTVQKRAAVLGTIANEKRGIAVAGTHGKTSVSTIITTILNEWEQGCSAFLGGISKNFGNNYIASAKSDFVVLEADEFDRSFLQLTPEFAIITAIDPDHLDIYKSYNELISTFNQFISLIKRGGSLLVNRKVLRLIKVPDYVKLFTYSITEEADFTAINIIAEEGRFRFDVATANHEVMNDIEFGLPGRINVENALAALAMSRIIGVENDIIIEQLKEFKGVIRRFDIQVRNNATIYIDDYAHHPEELNSTINSVRELYPEKKITGIFQPHLYSRTSDFALDFAESLSLLDKLYMLDIYPAREEPIPGVTSDLILKDVALDEKLLCKKEDIVELIDKDRPEILLTLGAGDIDQLVLPLKELLLN